MNEDSGLYTATIPIPAWLVEDAEWEVERRNRNLPDGERPIGLADLVAKALLAVLGYVECEEHGAVYDGPVCPVGDHFPSHTAEQREREALDGEDAAVLAEWKRERVS